MSYVALASSDENRQRSVVEKKTSDYCGEGLSIPEESHNNDNGVESRNNGNNCTVTVLGLYTTSVNEAINNIDNIIVTSVEITNQAL